MRPTPDINRLEREALRGLLPFQLETVRRVDALFRKNGGKTQRRVLVADEVGLGKTIVARGVIAKTARLRLEEGDDLFKVVYVCSNQNIAAQNVSRLQVEVGQNGSGQAKRREDPAESRLSMQHLLVEEQELEWAAEGRFVQILSITPETSFRMGNRTGRSCERALICAVLSGMDEFRNRRRALSRRLRCKAGSGWAQSVADYLARIEKVHARTPAYPGWLHQALRRRKGVGSEDGFRAVVEGLLASKSDKAAGPRIQTLRRMFAEAGADRLQPDLVVMDEFQRFRFLIRAEREENDETGILVRRFLHGEGRGAPRVLLLSATPFKPFSTRAETECEGADESFDEFREVVQFLFPDRFASVWKTWNGYVQSLKGYAVDGLDVHPDKESAEAVLREAICRTERERIGETADRGSTVIRVERILPEEREIRSYAVISVLAARLGGAGRPTIEQSKSTPFLLSFRGRDNYKEQSRLEEALADRKNRALLSRINRDGRKALWVYASDIRRYRDLPDSNARLGLLADMAFARPPESRRGAITDVSPSKAFHPERCLWIPPSVPAYPLAGPFIGAGGYSKTLVFSAWEMVPKAVASLLSYEAERLTIARCYARDRRHGDPPLDYFAANRYPGERLAFRMKDRKPASMSLFALLYPSRTLADVFSPTASRNGRWSLAETEKRIRATLRGHLRRLAAYQSVRSGPVDARWFYLAPMLLDGAENSAAWAREALAASKSIDSQETAAGRHFSTLERELKDPCLGQMPALKDMLDVLVDMALGSPAVCALRTLDGDRRAATLVAEAFRRHFGSPEAVAAVECAYARSDDAHWRNVLRYGKDGCLSAVLDEWVHFLRDDNKPVAEAITAALAFRTTAYVADTFEALKAWVDGKGESADRKRRVRFRSHFAAAFVKGENDDVAGVNRREMVLAAFNSPFRPFILASTSIGQEGLDFHRYCRRVFHWNLPANPVDFEQREGRVDRYKGLSVRQSLAASLAVKTNDVSGVDFWNQAFDAALEKFSAEASESGRLVPFWRLPGKVAFPVESIVPVLAFSRDEARLRRLRELLRDWRLAIGQPRQENLLDTLRTTHPGFDPHDLFLNLSPWFHRPL